MSNYERGRAVVSEADVERAIEVFDEAHDAEIQRHRENRLLGECYPRWAGMRSVIAAVRAEAPDLTALREAVPPFWAAARESAAQVQAGPAWMRAGIRLSPEHFETHAPEEGALCSVPCRRCGRVAESLIDKLGIAERTIAATGRVLDGAGVPGRIVTIEETGTGVVHDVTTVADRARWLANQRRAEAAAPVDLTATLRVFAPGLRLAAEHHRKQAAFGGAARELHARCQTAIDVALDLLTRLGNGSAALIDAAPTEPRTADYARGVEDAAQMAEHWASSATGADLLLRDLADRMRKVLGTGAEPRTAEQERADVVAWLRGPGLVSPQRPGDAIEDGEHVGAAKEGGR